MSIPKDRPLIDAIELIYKNHTELFADPKKLEDCQEAIACITHFFEVEPTMAAIIGLIVYDQMLDDTTPLKQYMKRMGFSVLQAANTLESIHQIRKKGWLQQSKRRGLQGKMCFELTKQALDAVLLNDANRLISNLAESQNQALLLLHKQFQQFSGEDVLPDIILNFANAHAEMPFFKTILNDQKLMECDRLILLWMGAEFVNGNEEPELHWISDSVFDACREEVNRFKFNVRHNPHMREQNYIQFASKDFPDVNRCMLGDALLNTFNDIVSIKKHRPSLRQCQLLESEHLQSQKMHYNHDFAEHIQELYTITGSEQFAAITEKCQRMGLPQGLTILLSGPPGTGKTETVKQLARFHKRDLLLVNMAEFKSMWLGESEKNVSKIFREYKAYKSYREHTPILFMNEADALISKRQQIETTVGQSLNTIQNILLQALEDFEGILIATTNLSQNFDTAFDRRFLYKLHFDLPDAVTQTAIINQELSMIHADLQKQIASNYSLSGAQILNLKRRIVMRQMILPDFIPDWKWLEDLLASETKIQNQNEIGFRRAG